MHLTSVSSAYHVVVVGAGRRSGREVTRVVCDRGAGGVGLGSNGPRGPGLDVRRGHCGRGGPDDGYRGRGPRRGVGGDRSPAFPPTARPIRPPARRPRRFTPGSSVRAPDIRSRKRPVAVCDRQITRQHAGSSGKANIDHLPRAFPCTSPPHSKLRMLSGPLPPGMATPVVMAPPRV